MKTNFRSVLVSLLVFLTGWSGLLGGAGVAVLCVHDSSSFHLSNPDHEVECCDSDKVFKADLLTELTLLGYCDHCFDFEFKGVEVQVLVPTRNKNVFAPVQLDKFFGFTELSLTGFEVSKGSLPLMRAPCLVNIVTELCVKKTVLRI